MQSPDTQAVPEHPTAAFASQDFSGCDRCQTTRGNTNAAFRGQRGFVSLLTSLAIPRDAGSPCGCPSSPYKPSRASFQRGVREARGSCLQKPHDYLLPPKKASGLPNVAANAKRRLGVRVTSFGLFFSSPWLFSPFSVAFLPFLGCFHPDFLPYRFLELLQATVPLGNTKWLGGKSTPFSPLKLTEPQVPASSSSECTWFMIACCTAGPDVLCSL